MAPALNIMIIAIIYLIHDQIRCPARARQRVLDETQTDTATVIVSAVTVTVIMTGGGDPVRRRLAQLTMSDDSVQ